MASAAEGEHSPEDAGSIPVSINNNNKLIFLKEVQDYMQPF
jgi:hypothetical protein